MVASLANAALFASNSSSAMRGLELSAVGDSSSDADPPIDMVRAWRVVVVVVVMGVVVMVVAVGVGKEVEFQSSASERRSGPPSVC